MAKKLTKKQRSAAAKKGWRKRRAKAAAKKRTRKTGKRKATRKTKRKATRRRAKRQVGYGRGKVGRRLKRGYAYYKGKKPRVLKGRKRTRKLPKSRVYLTNKKRRSTRRRTYRRNVFGVQWKQLAVTGALFATGFFGHRVLTNVVRRFVTGKLAQKALDAGKPWSNTTAIAIDTGAQLGIAVLGVIGASQLAPKYKTEVGAGMIASALHGVLNAVLMNAAGDAGKKAAFYLQGTGQVEQAAAGLGRYRRRPMAGLGREPQVSILPRYAPTGLPGGMQQAVAGRLGTGEYFQTSGVGEYFASGVQGIGQYEMAGPLVTQAAAGVGQAIDDGIRPDSNLDNVLMLAEAQAGLGEYYSASPGGDLFTVPQQDQWIPNGPLWAGTSRAQDSQATSEVPAGILETPGGNGIFG